jgi:hypothetical protein
MAECTRQKRKPRKLLSSFESFSMKLNGKVTNSDETKGFPESADEYYERRTR